MKIIAQANLAKSLKTVGFQQYSESAHRVIESALTSFVKNALEKAHKQALNEGISKVDVKHVHGAFQSKKQRGGAETTLPLEYFGVDSKHYSDTAPQGTDMTVTDALVRPAFEVNDPAGVFPNTIVGGGGKQFSVPFVSVQRAVEKAGVSASQKAQKALHQKFEFYFNQVLAKVSKLSSGGHLKAADLNQVLEKRPFQKLFKQ